MPIPRRHQSSHNENRPSPSPRVTADGSKVLTRQMLQLRCRSDRLDMIAKLNLWGSDLGDVGIIGEAMPALEVCSLSVNRIRTLSGFQGCSRLRELYLRKNAIRELEEVDHLRRHCRNLEILLLEDNPCSEHPNYREYVISRLPWLSILDNKDVTAEERQAVAATSSRTASPLSPASSELYNGGVHRSRASILSGGDHSFVSCADDSGMAQGGERVRSSNEGPSFQECDVEGNPAADDDDPRRRRGSWASEEEETSAIQRDSARFGSGRCSSIAGGGPLWEGLLRDSTAVPPASRGSGGGGHDDTYDLSVSYAVEQQQQPRAGSEVLPRDSFMSMHSSSPVESPVVVEDSCWRASVDRSRLTSRTRRSSEGGSRVLIGLFLCFSAVPLGEEEEDGRSINVGEDDSLEEKSDNNIVTAVLALLQELDDESMVRVKLVVDRRLAASSRNAAGA
ncbi:hypothetical protein FOZ63_020480 [Perkinsus olseni]|uniref:Uncharacterized protein n=1 Tax=Perkinsus olseni TaxID=32597 RepID=A0A7J6Q0U5_PEROL|nr:hypothetical protein FOZ63_020480 [Perkinsus olseni]KAF4719702.1 hypothetical protein FOZ62_024449 [Perkinsus olseni]